MTFEEMEKSVKELRDNQIVQGYRLGRTESNLDRLEMLVERNAQQIERNSQAIEKLAHGFMLLQSAMEGMVRSVDGLSATVDRFIRGMEHNGHHPPDDGPEEVH
jgi:methyl-accepting chemotaxis protein